MAVIKRQVYGDATRDVVDATSRAEVLLHEAMPRPDVIEGITSFLEKRPPQFPSLDSNRRLVFAGDAGKDDHGQLGLQGD